MQLKFTAPLIAGSLLLTSCATVLTKRSYNFHINYAQNGTKIRYKDSTYDQPPFIRVKRSKEPLVFTAFKDSIARRYEIRKVLNPMFVWGDIWSILTYPAAPIVYGIDLTNPKRFHYGNNLKVTLNDTSAVVTKPTVRGRFDRNEPGYDKIPSKIFYTEPTQKGDLYWSVSWPLHLYNASYPGAGRKTTAGGAALSTGLEYYYKDRRALGINAGIYTSPFDLMETFPSNIGPYYSEEQFSYVYVDLYHKHTVKRFSLAYGLNYSYNTWKSVTHSFGLTFPDMPDVRVTNHSFGAMFSGYYQFNPYFKFGVIYRPTLLRVYPGTTAIYQHTISFDVALTIKAKSKKK
jgi:hypothetical protein